MKKTIYLFILVFTSLSCSNSDKEVAALMKEKVQSMSGNEVVRDLLIENENDAEQLARIFNCSVPTIMRVKNKETYLTNNASTEFKNLLAAVKISGEDTFKENDPYYDSWIRSFRYWLNSYVLWGVGAFVLFFIIGFTGGDVAFAGYIDFSICVVFIGGYFLTWILNMLFPYLPPANLFLEKINPLFETLL